MIYNLVTAMQLVILLISISLLLYLLLIKRDNSISSYMVFLLDLCMLWTLLI